MITAEVAAGRANPDSAVKYLQAQVSKAYPDGDYVLEAPDPLAAQKALQEQFLQEQFQFALRNPDAGVYDANGVFTGLKDEHKAEFVRGQNEALYGIKGTPDEEKLARVRASGNLEELGLTKKTMYDNPVYKALLASPETVTLTPTMRIAGKKPSMKTGVLSNVPHTGGFMNIGGRIFRFDKQETVDVAFKKDNTSYDFTDPVTGEKLNVFVNGARGSVVIGAPGGDIASASDFLSKSDPWGRYATTPATAPATAPVAVDPYRDDNPNLDPWAI
jgi:hypothetical protein